MSLGRGLSSLIPTEPPQPAEIPGLTYVPGRVRSFDLEAPGVDGDATHAAVADLLSRVQAEDERVRRLLPPAPAGYEWRGEVQSRQDLDLIRNRGDLTVRIVYGLRKIGEENIDNRVAWS